jgi:hypothetical protein
MGAAECTALTLEEKCDDLVGMLVEAKVLNVREAS